MKNIFTIIFRLTVSCLLAGLVMGTAFIFTDKAKKHNEHVNEQKVTYSLLGYSKKNPPPESMELHDIFRYIISENGVQSIAYLVPVDDKGKRGYTLVRLDLNGKLLDNQAVEIEEDRVLEDGDRDAAIQKATGPGKKLTYAEKTVVATDGGKRTAYLIEGKFPGFKTFIAVMLALDPEFSLLGFEVMEHEEDPGLGGEIEQDYFKNQFKGKSFEVLKKTSVVKEPIPSEYLLALENKIDDPKRSQVLEEYRNNDIYALTGATISSRSVNDGVRAMVKKFAYRMGVLDSILQEQNIDVAF